MRAFAKRADEPRYVYKICKVLYEEGAKNIYDRSETIEWLRCALNDPDLLLAMIRSRFLPAQDAFDYLFLEKKDFYHIINEAGIKQILIILLSSDARYSMLDKETEERTLTNQVKQRVTNHPLSWFSVLLFHEAILRGDLVLFRFYQDKGIKIVYQPNLLAELLQTRTVTKSMFSEMIKNLEQLKAYEFLPPAAIDNAMRQLCEAVPVYNHDFEFPAVYREAKEAQEEAPAVQASAKQSLIQHIPELFIQLNIDKTLFPMFFKSHKSKTTTSASEPVPSGPITDKRAYALLEDPLACIQSINYILANKTVVLSAFVKLSEAEKKGVLETMCTIALQEGLPGNLHTPFINLIDRLVDPDYAIMLTDLQKPKQLKQATLPSFFSAQPPAPTAEKKDQREKKETEIKSTSTTPRPSDSDS